MAGLIQDDPADRGARLEAEIFRGRQFQRVSLVVPEDMDRHELRRACGDPQLVNRRARGPFDGRRTVIAGHDGRLQKLAVVDAGGVLDGYAFDRFVRPRGEGAERQFPRGFPIRGPGDVVGLRCRSGLRRIALRDGPACSARVMPKPPMSTRSTLPTKKAGMINLQESGVRNTFRFKASRRRRTSDVRPWRARGPAMARPPARPAGQRPAVRGHIAEQVGGDGIADGVARRRVRRGSARPADGTRAGSKRDAREVPGQIVIPRVASRGRGWRGGRRAAGRRTRDRARAGPVHRPRPGTGSRPRESAAPGRPDDNPAARRSSGTPRRSAREHPRSPDGPRQSPTPHDQPNGEDHDAGQPDATATTRADRLAWGPRSARRTVTSEGPPAGVRRIASNGPRIETASVAS